LEEVEWTEEETLWILCRCEMFENWSSCRNTTPTTFNQYYPS
jgi:hypothetical protein